MLLCFILFCQAHPLGKPWPRRPERRPGGKKTLLWLRRIELETIMSNLTLTVFDLWLWWDASARTEGTEASLLFHSLSPLKGHEDQKRCLRTQRKEMTSQSSKMGRRRTQGTSGQFPRKVKDRLFLDTVSEHEDKSVARSSQRGFIKRKSCLTNLIAFYDETTTWMDEGRVVDGCPGLWKAFSWCFS